MNQILKNIKMILIKLALEDKLPLNMQSFDESLLKSAFKGKKITTIKKKKPIFKFTSRQETNFIKFLKRIDNLNGNEWDSKHWLLPKNCPLYTLTKLYDSKRLKIYFDRPVKFQNKISKQFIFKF